MGTWTHTLLQEMDRDESLLERDEQSTTLRMKDEVVGCTHAECPCECFLPGPAQIRSCDRCAHGWVVHAVGKLCAPALLCSGQVEIVQSNVVFDISSLILYGTQALPVRMKILLDRLFSVLTHTQDSLGRVLDRWVTMSPEDEVVTLHQFLRFGETKSIVELMTEEQQIRPETHRNPAFKPRDKPPSRTHPFENLPGGSLAFLQPFHCVSASVFPPSHPATQRLSKQNNGAEEMRTRNKRDGAPERSLQIRSSTRSPKRLRNVEQRQVGVDELISDSSGAGERSSSKARVSCSACAKTFYDKGTLKIHFNAVHLKIKHRCTVEGCNMMFSSLRSRNRHSANPNPRLHAALEQTTRRFLAQPRRPVLRDSTSPVSMENTSTVLTDHQIPVSREGGGGGATGNRTANQNGLSHVIDVMPKKKSRKSSTPLKLKQDTHSEEHDHLSQAVNSLHCIQSPMTITQGQHNYKHLWIQGVHDEWKGRRRPLLKVKEEPCDPTCDCRGHHRSNL